MQTHYFFHFSMKILFFSGLFILFANCGSDITESTDDPTSFEGEERPKGTPDGESGTDSINPPTPNLQLATDTNDLCTRTCVGNEECGEKYNVCLRPKAGPVDTTETVACLHSTLPQKTLVLNEWSAPAGQNNLLCDFIENKEYLYRFATISRGVCRVAMNNRKKDLISEGYECGEQPPLATARAAAQEAPREMISSSDPCKAPCTNTEECRTKHKTCLKPVSGQPTLTETTKCEKSGGLPVLLIINEWNNPPNQNKLLCDLNENKEVLRYATIQKNTCQLAVEKRKQELMDAGYRCQLQ